MSLNRMPFYSTPYCKIILLDDVAKLLKLLELDDSVLEIRFEDDCDLLMESCKHGAVRICEFLLQIGFNFKRKDEWGLTAKDHASIHSDLTTLLKQFESREVSDHLE